MSRSSIGLLSLLLAGLIFSLKPVFAQEDLILEQDEDEYTAQSFSKGQVLGGYEDLLSLKSQELEGLNAVLLPLSDEIFTLEGQQRGLEAQKKRNEELRRLLERKYEEILDLGEKVRVREELLRLELKGIVNRFERLLLMTFQVKREILGEDGKVNLLNLFSTLSPKEAVFRDFLLTRLRDQLLSEMSEGLKVQRSIQALSNRALMFKENLGIMDRQLLGNAESLSQQITFQAILVSEKKDEKTFFQTRLDVAKEEQKILQQRIADLASRADYAEYQSLPAEDVLWPVTPGLGISTRFLDPAYRTRFGIDHQGIDIPTDQLTPVRAAISGKVVKVHEGGGAGYSYLQLLHRDGYSTVYGHLYEFRVRENDEVSQGDIIAFSGGALGTRGAGKLSTGPHLHFEILQYGKAVDPELYLP